MEVLPARAIVTAIGRSATTPVNVGGAIEGSSSGSIDRSAKLRALDAVLQRWKSQKHRALVFSQSVKMLDILEALAQQRRYAMQDGRLDTSHATTSHGGRL